MFFIYLSIRTSFSAVPRRNFHLYWVISPAVTAAGQSIQSFLSWGHGFKISRSWLVIHQRKLSLQRHLQCDDIALSLMINSINFCEQQSKFVVNASIMGHQCSLNRHQPDKLSKRCHHEAVTNVITSPFHQWLTSMVSSVKSQPTGKFNT